MLIPFSASSASFILSVSSSTLAGAGSFPSAIKTPDIGGEELNATGDRQVGRYSWLVYLHSEKSQPVAEFGANAGIFTFV